MTEPAFAPADHAQTPTPAAATGRVPAPSGALAHSRDDMAHEGHGGGLDDGGDIGANTASTASDITYQAAVNEVARLLGLAGIHLRDGEMDKAEAIAELAERWRVLAKFIKDHESLALPSLGGMALPPPPLADPDSTQGGQQASTGKAKARPGAR